MPRSLKNRSAFFVSLHFFVPNICIFKSALLCPCKFLINPCHDHIHKIILMYLAEFSARLHLMPFSDAFPTAGCRCMLRNKYRMSFCWCLLSIVWNKCRCFTLYNKILCVLSYHIQAFLIDVIKILLL